MRAVVERAVAFGLACGLAHLVGEFARELRLALGRPLTDRDQVLRQALDRVAERPFLRLLLGAVAVWVVARRMRPGAVGEEFDQRRAVIAARPFGGPAGRGVDGEKIVAVDPQAREAEADRAGGERRLLAARHLL